MQDTENVAVALTGAVYVAPAGTAIPVNLDALTDPWEDVGYIGDDGVNFGISRETEDITAWQTRDIIRRLLTSEPKTIGFELIQFDPVTVALALRGGTFEVGEGGGASPVFAEYTPSEGSTDTRAMVIDAIDGDVTFRFCYSNVEISGDVEWNLLASDAIRFPLEFGVLAGTPTWKVYSDHPAWIESATGLGLAGARGSRRKAIA